MDGSAVRVGASALSYLFPAPTGIVDYRLRDPGEKLGASTVIYAGPFSSQALDFDARVPLPQLRLRVPIGASYRIDAPLPGFVSTVIEVGAAPGLMRSRCPLGGDRRRKSTAAPK